MSSPQSISAEPQTLTERNGWWNSFCKGVTATGSGMMWLTNKTLGLQGQEPQQALDPLSVIFAYALLPDLQEGTRVSTVASIVDFESPSAIPGKQGWVRFCKDANHDQIPNSGLAVRWGAILYEPWQEENHKIAFAFEKAAEGFKESADLYLGLNKRYNKSASNNYKIIKEMAEAAVHPEKDKHQEMVQNEMAQRNAALLPVKLIWDPVSKEEALDHLQKLYEKRSLAAELDERLETARSLGDLESARRLTLEKVAAVAQAEFSRSYLFQAIVKANRVMEEWRKSAVLEEEEVPTGVKIFDSGCDLPRSGSQPIVSPARCVNIDWEGPSGSGSVGSPPAGNPPVGSSPAASGDDRDQEISLAPVDGPDRFGQSPIGGFDDVSIEDLQSSDE